MTTRSVWIGIILALTIPIATASPMHVTVPQGEGKSDKMSFLHTDILTEHFASDDARYDLPRHRVRKTRTPVEDTSVAVTSTSSLAYHFPDARVTLTADRPTRVTVNNVSKIHDVQRAPQGRVVNAYEIDIEGDVRINATFSYDENRNVYPARYQSGEWERITPVERGNDTVTFPITTAATPYSLIRPERGEEDGGERLGSGGGFDTIHPPREDTHDKDNRTKGVDDDETQDSTRQTAAEAKEDAEENVEEDVPAVTGAAVLDTGEAREEDERERSHAALDTALGGVIGHVADTRPYWGWIAAILAGFLAAAYLTSTFFVDQVKVIETSDE